MKNSFLWLVLGCSMTLAPLLFAADTGTAADTSTTTPNSEGEHKGFWKQAIEQLNLSEAQKQQIQQIRAKTQPGKDRRQQIMAVLTPDQKQQLIALLKEHHASQAAQ